jgi:hypothetical protein
MPYEVAPNWKGEYLPHGAAGMPASHPYQFVYARPRYLGRGKGFSGLGQTACNIASTPACSWTDSFYMSSACQAALDNCTYGSGAALPLVNPPGAGSISTADLIAQNANPTGSNVAPDAAAALIAAQNALAVSAACPAGYVAQSNGTCAPPAGFSMPWWGWALIVGGGVLLVTKR